MRSKFNIDTSAKGKIKRTYDGITFDSEVEMKAYRDYFLPMKNEGKICNITMQPKFILQPKYEKDGKKILPIVYISDFEIEYLDGTIVVFDIKGQPTTDAILKRKMFNYIYPDKKLRWISFSKLDGGFVDIEIIEKGRKARKKTKGNT